MQERAANVGHFKKKEKKREKDRQTDRKRIND